MENGRKEEKKNIVFVKSKGARRLFLYSSHRLNAITSCALPFILITDKYFHSLQSRWFDIISTIFYQVHRSFESCLQAWSNDLICGLVCTRNWYWFRGKTRNANANNYQQLWQISNQFTNCMFITIRACKRSFPNVHGNWLFTQEPTVSRMKLKYGYKLY